MVVVPGGSFMMGAPESEVKEYPRAPHSNTTTNTDADRHERPQHRVSIRSFAVGKYEVTFGEWDACVADGGCRGYRPNHVPWRLRAENFGRGRFPVMHIRWHDAKAYVRWLSERTGEAYRLLSESEWEYAARAGSTTPFHTGETITSEQANYYGNFRYPDGRNLGCPPPISDRPWDWTACVDRNLYRFRTLPVGSFAPNAFGLHDVHGNVREWVEDCWSHVWLPVGDGYGRFIPADYTGAPTDGSAVTSCTPSHSGTAMRILRGGGWQSAAPWIRSADRNIAAENGLKIDTIGFRVARTITP